MLCDCVVLRDHSFLSFFWCVFLFSPSLHGLWYVFFSTNELRSILSQRTLCSIHVYMSMNAYFHVICSALDFLWTHAWFDSAGLVCRYNGVLPVAALLLVHKHFCGVHCLPVRRSLSAQSIWHSLTNEQWPLRSHFNSTLLYISICSFVSRLVDLNFWLHFTKSICF